VFKCSGDEIAQAQRHTRRGAAEEVLEVCKRPVLERTWTAAQGAETAAQGAETGRSGEAVTDV
jgi:hypothetical protein